MFVWLVRWSNSWVSEGALVQAHTKEKACELASEYMEHSGGELKIAAKIEIKDSRAEEKVITWA